MALNNHVKWYKKRHPFCFLCKSSGGGQCREMEICKDSLLHLHGIKRKFTSVGSGSGSLTTASASSSGILATPPSEFVFPGPEFGCQAGGGALGFHPTLRARAAAGSSGSACLKKHSGLLFTLGLLLAHGWPRQALQMHAAGGP